MEFTKNWTKGQWAQNIATLLIPLILLLIPCGEVYTLQMKLFFASTVCAILCLCFNNVPQISVCLLLPLFWIFAGVADAWTVFTPFTMYIPWTVLAGMLMANVLLSTGLLTRVSYWIISKVGGSYAGVLLAISLVSFFGVMLVGDVVIPVATLAFGMCTAFNFGKSKASAGIMLIAAVTSIGFQYVKFNAPMMLIGYGMEVTGPMDLPGFFEVFIYTWPFVLFTFLMVPLAAKMFKPEEEINGKAYFKEQLANMGSLSVAEKKAALVVIIYFIFVVTQGFGGIFDLYWGMAFVPLLMIVPGIGPATPKDLQRLDFGFVLFITTCMGIGMVAVSLGIGQILVDVVVPLLEGKSHFVFFIAEWVICTVANFVMTPNAIFAAFTVPFASIAQALGIDVMAVYLFLNVACDQIFFPYEYALYMIFFAFGVMEMKDFIKFMSVKTVLNFVFCFLLWIPYWTMIGFY